MDTPRLVERERLKTETSFILRNKVLRRVDLSSWVCTQLCQRKQVCFDVGKIKIDLQHFIQDQFLMTCWCWLELYISLLNSAQLASTCHQKLILDEVLKINFDFANIKADLLSLTKLSTYSRAEVDSPKYFIAQYKTCLSF